MTNFLLFCLALAAYIWSGAWFITGLKLDRPLSSFAGVTGMIGSALLLGQVCERILP